MAAANACMTHEMRGKISGLFDRMGKDELTAIADSFTRFELSSTSGSNSEGYVTRNGRAGIVTFMKQGKEWLIAQM